MLITYIIPVFNERKTVEKSIQDILDLKLEKEIIIIDNNSTDGSKEIIQKFQNYQNIITVEKNQNLGFGHSIQKGFELAKGKYIFIQYADLEYDHLASLKMLKYAEKQEIDVVFASRLINLNKSKILQELIKKPSYLATLICTFLINFFYNKNLTDIIGTKLYNREKVTEFVPKNNGQGFDFEFVSVICKKNLLIKEMHIDYTPRKDSNEKKIKFYHMFNAIFEILKIKFFK
jgi:glycosyltransferase involved in cell wall biosynthesis